MAELMAPWLTAGICLPLIAAAASALPAAQRHLRTIGASAAAAAFLCCLAGVFELLATGWSPMAEPWLIPVFSADSFNAVTMTLFAFLALVTIVASPRRDIGAKSVRVFLVLLGGTLAAYGANFVAPVEFIRRLGAPDIFSYVLLLLTAAALATRRFERAEPLTAGLLLNAHFGLLLIVRIAIPLFPALAREAGPGLGLIALFAALSAAVVGTVERDPRRLLTLIFIGQALSILAALLTASPEGTMGGLLQWIVLGVAFTVLFSILRALEVRIDRPLAAEQFLGLAPQMPRLAVFFAVAAFAVVGLPGTLGFPGDDLLIHGVLAAHPVLGMLLPATIAVNAYSIYKLFAKLFLGPSSPAWKNAPDASRRERWAFSVCLLILVWGGIAPQHIVALRSSAADVLAGMGP